MSHIVADIWFAVGFGGTVFGAIYYGFNLLEENASDEIKAPISAWLQRAKFAKATAISTNVSFAFRSFFGQRQLSWQCVRRVFFFSVVAMAVSLVVLGGWKPLFQREEVKCGLEGLGGRPIPPEKSGTLAPFESKQCPPGELCFDNMPVPCYQVDVTGNAAKALGTFFALINLPIDYLAVGITRLLLAGLTVFQTRWVLAALFMLLDVLSKGVLLVFGLIILAELQTLLATCSPENLCLAGPAWDYLVGLFSGTQLTSPIARASLLAMLLSSLWIWMYNFCLIALGSPRAGAVANFLRRALDIGNHPIRSVGFLASLLSGVVSVLLVLLMQTG